MWPEQRWKNDRTGERRTFWRENSACLALFAQAIAEGLPHMDLVHEAGKLIKDDLHKGSKKAIKNTLTIASSMQAENFVPYVNYLLTSTTFRKELRDNPEEFIFFLEQVFRHAHAPLSRGNRFHSRMYQRLLTPLSTPHTVTDEKGNPVEEIQSIWDCLANINPKKLSKISNSILRLAAVAEQMVKDYPNAKINGDGEIEEYVLGEIGKKFFEKYKHRNMLPHPRRTLSHEYIQALLKRTKQIFEEKNAGQVIERTVVWSETIGLPESPTRTVYDSHMPEGKFVRV